MRLAVFDTVGNFGGGSRFLESLLPALRNRRPGLRMTYFGNPESVRREGHGNLLSANGIAVKDLPSLRLATDGILGIRASAKFVRSIQKRSGQRPFLPASLAGAVHREIERVVDDFDIAYFPWPYLVRCPRLRIPAVATFHDFNFRYFFGLPVFDRRQDALLTETMPEWLSRTVPVVSTKFMASEIASFYPQCRSRIKVVYLAPLLPDSGIGEEEAASVVAKLGVRRPYVIYPTHLTVHKNIGPLLVAIWLLGEQGHDISLVLTGHGTQAATGRACVHGVAKRTETANVLGLGYVTNRQMDALIRNASAVVSTSLYEAGNGPGLDAWARGVPVAMSRIPPFLEHVEVQGVQAELFDPRSPRDIAEKIASILSDPGRTRKAAAVSRQRIREVTWARTADEYLAVFDEAMG